MMRFLGILSRYSMMQSTRGSHIAASSATCILQPTSLFFNLQSTLVCSRSETTSIHCRSLHILLQEAITPSNLLPLYRSHYLPLMLTRPELQIPHPLPRPQRQLPITNRNRNTSTNQCALDMCLSPTIS